MRSEVRAVLAASLFAATLLSPSVSCEAAPSPRLLLEVADLSGPAIAPNGQAVAFRQEQASVARNVYDSAWYVEPLDGHGPALRVADGGAPLFTDAGTVISEPPQWSPDSRWIYYRALLGGQIQVWRAAADGAQVTAVTHDGADVEAFALSADGRQLVYRVGAPRAAIREAEDAEYDAGIRVDEHTPVGQSLYHGGFVNGRRASVRRTGDWAGRGGLLGEVPPRLKIVDLKSLSERDATTRDLATAGENLPAAGPSIGSGSYLFMARSAQTRDLAGASIVGGTMALQVKRGGDTGAAVDCSATACHDTASLAWRPGRDEVVFTTTDQERGRAQSLYLWDVDSGRVRLIAQVPGLLGGGRGLGFNEPCAVGARFAVCVTASADVPPQLIRVDLVTGAQTGLYAPNQALAQLTGPRARLLRWSDAAGDEFTGQFFAPARGAAPGPAPLFVTYYSCSGFLRGALGDEWPLASLAAAGIGALCINEPRTDPTHLDQIARYQRALLGVRAIVARLAQEGLADPARVGMGGLSFGSEVTLWTAMNSDLLAAASVTSPSVTPTYYRFHALQGPGWKSTLKRIWGLGAPEETPERWRLLSPAFHADQIHAPMLMQMPEQEYLEAMDYFAPLANSKTPAEMYVFADEPHIKVQPRHKLAAYERNLDWFRFWLQDYVDPDPAKAAQYQRWAAMRDRAQTAARPSRSERPPLSGPSSPARP